MLSFDCKNIIIGEQHGFCQGKSTVTNLVRYTNVIFNSLESGYQVDSIYADFSKAFDRVNHEILMAKLYGYGIGDNISNWIKNYLSNRTQMVKYGNCSSKPFQITSGVPQGSHLGPLLFNLFVNDLHTVFESDQFLLFADDIKIFRPIVRFSDCDCLQLSLNNFSRWCEINVLNLNLKKCFKITFRKTQNYYNNNYTLNGAVLQVIDQIRDLGVTLDKKMSFNDHINDMTSRAFKMLGFIQRNSQEFSVFTFKILYCSLVRSIMEYCSIIWCPFYNAQKSQLEKVQNKFLRICGYKMGLRREDYDYSFILSQLKMNTLETRRTQFELYFLHKLINGYVNCPEILDLVKFNTPTRRTRNSDLFFVDFHSTNYGINEVISRMLRTANSYQK